MGKREEVNDFFFGTKYSFNKFSSIWLNSVINWEHVPSPNLPVQLTKITCFNSNTLPPATKFTTNIESVVVA